MAVGFDKFDVDKVRKKLRKLSDEELIREGKAARYMCAPSTNFGKTTTRRLRDRATPVHRRVASASSQT